MIQFQILSGKQAGSVVLAKRFPWQIGRARAADLRLEEDGIWDQHLTLALQPAQGFSLHLHPNARATVNGQSFQTIRLRNGDLIEAGPVKIQFWLSETRQAGLRLRETLTWLGLIGLCALQLAIIYALLR